jgi:acetoin utilization deacetylase AcuC-like enzyme
MTLLYYDPLFLQHDTGNHPENAGRLIPIVRQFDMPPYARATRAENWEPASTTQLELVHGADHIARVQAVAQRGGGNLDPDTVLSRASFDAARLAAGAVCDAVSQVVRGADHSALCLVRPPGHHALPSRAMGFCLFGNIAVGARWAIRELGLDRVLVVDWDVHHGNGTQDVFWRDSQVGFFSMHRYPFYPGSGAAGETGQGAGLGTTHNLPVRFGTPRADQLAAFRFELEEFANEIRPQLVLISAGFDSHRDDPVGSLGLESEDFSTLTEAVLDVAAVHAEGRVVSVLEGGYNPTALAACVGLHLEELLERERTGS